MLNQNPEQLARDHIDQLLIAAIESQELTCNMIKDYITASFHVHRENFELDPFSTKEAGKNVADAIIDELHDILVA